MKFQRSSFVFAMILFSAPLLFSGCHSKETDKQPETQNPKPRNNSYYTCSMHPQIHQDKPGDCPICGMKLIKVEETQEEDTTPLDSSLRSLTEPVTKTVIGSFETITPVRSKLADTLLADGYIDFDERAINNINTRVTGRIEKLYVKYNNQKISKGQPLFTIYSPELVSVQRDLLQAEKNNEPLLLTALKEKLLNLGMTENEITAVLQNKKPSANITIYSSYSGISRPVNSIDRANDRSTSPGVKEGMYVNKRQPVFAIQNINKTWAILNIFDRDIGQIHRGDKVSMYSDADPTTVIRGRIDFILPDRPQQEKTSRVRVYLNNLPENWKIGTLIHGRIAIDRRDQSLYIPLTAVNDLGLHHVVWVQDEKQKDVFRAKEIETGMQTGDSIEVISGIKAEDKIAANAAYMVGSDSFIQ